MPGGQIAHLGCIDIADHHQGGVIGRVPLLVPALQVVRADSLDILHPADDRLPVGTGQIGGRLKLLPGQGLGLILGAQAPFLGNYLGFLGHVLGLEQQVAHAVRFKAKAQFQARLLKSLEIGGVVVAGEGVFITTIGGDQAREFASGHRGRALEHQVFEQMRDARQAARLIAGADLVPDLRDHHRGAVILADQDFQTIIEGKDLDRRGAKSGRAHRQQQGAKQQGGAVHRDGHRGEQGQETFRGETV